MLTAMVTQYTDMFKDMGTYHYLAVGGGAVAFLAIICYFVPVAKIKIPAVIVGSICGVLSGIGVGVMIMAFFGYHWERYATQQAGDEQGGGGGRMGGPPGMMGGPAGGRMGGPAGGGLRGGFGARPANSKNQLVDLVSKIDQMTAKPLNLSLTEEQRKKVHEQIQGLETLIELTEDDAKKRLDVLLEIVKDEKEKMEAAGYRWPGSPPAQRASSDSPNPFKSKENTDHVKSLVQQLTKK